MANNFLKQLLNVVETGKLLGVTNIRDLYNTGFANSGISYKDFKKQMHDYKIYGNLGKNDMARLSGMYYGSKNVDFQEGRKAHMIDRDNGSLVYKDSNLAITPTLSLIITPLNIPVSRPIILKTVVKSAPKNNSNKQLVAEVTKVVIPANSGDPNNWGLTDSSKSLTQNYDNDALNRQKHGGFALSNTNEHNVYKNSRFKKWWDNLNIDDAVDNSLYGLWTDKWNKEGRRGIKENIKTIMGLGDYIRDLMTILKKQLGGQVKSSNKELDAVMLFVKALAQTLQADPQLVIQAAQLNPEALKSAVQVYQESKGDIQKAAQAFSQAISSKTQAAKHGTKLNYLKSLKNKCAEDEELYYFKKGGSIGCGCKKKEEGGEIKEQKESPINNFKNRKITKHQLGGKNLPTAPAVIDAYTGGTYVEDVGLPWYNKLLGIKNRTQIIGPRNIQKYPRVLERIVTNNNDTIYKETPAYDPDVVITGPTTRTAKSSDSNRSEYDILNRRFKLGEALLGYPKSYKELKSIYYKKGGEIKKDCGGSKMKLKKGDKVHAAGIGCSVAKFKYRKLGGQL